jgi:hypothetical protein
VPPLQEASSDMPLSSQRGCCGTLELLLLQSRARVLFPRTPRP